MLSSPFASDASRRKGGEGPLSRPGNQPRAGHARGTSLLPRSPKRHRGAEWAGSHRGAEWAGALPPDAPRPGPPAPGRPRVAPRRPAAAAPPLRGAVPVGRSPPHPAAMGKSRGKDRMYLSAKEWATEGGGRSTDQFGKARSGGAAVAAAPSSRLPLGHCALSLRLAEAPVCAPDGTVFDASAAVPLVKRTGRHPTLPDTRLTLSDLVPLAFDRAATFGEDGSVGGDGASVARKAAPASGALGAARDAAAPFRCPVTGRALTDARRDGREGEGDRGIGRARATPPRLLFPRSSSDLEPRPP